MQSRHDNMGWVRPFGRPAASLLGPLVGLLLAGLPATSARAQYADPWPVDERAPVASQIDELSGGARMPGPPIMPQAAARPAAWPSGAATSATATPTNATGTNNAIPRGATASDYPAYATDAQTLPPAFDPQYGILPSGASSADPRFAAAYATNNAGPVAIGNATPYSPASANPYAAPGAATYPVAGVGPYAAVGADQYAAPSPSPYTTPNAMPYASSGAVPPAVSPDTRYGAPLNATVGPISGAPLNAAAPVAAAMQSYPAAPSYGAAPDAAETRLASREPLGSAWQATLPGATSAAAAPAPAGVAPAEAVSALKLCERAQVVAQISSEPILLSDLTGAIDAMLRRAGKSLPADQVEAERGKLLEAVASAVDEAALDPRYLSEEQAARRMVLKQILQQMIEAKIVYLDARGSIPKENIGNVEKQIYAFFEQTEVKGLMKRAGVETWRDLDAYLRDRGSSFERERQAFFESTLSHEWLRQHVKIDSEVTVDQMLKYYHEHSDEFDVPAQTRWQMLCVRYSQFMTKSEAFAAIAKMGNQSLSGSDFATVVKSNGEIAAECDGNIHTWPDDSQPIPDVVEDAIKRLPSGQLSPVLDDWRGYYIVRVVERVPPHRTSFEEAQSDIRDKVKSRRTDDEVQKYLTELRRRYPIWTVLDRSPAADDTAAR